jgi:hypothetical protein
LHHSMTSEQLASLDTLVQAAKAVVECQDAQDAQDTQGQQRQQRQQRQCVTNSINLGIVTHEMGDNLYNWQSKYKNLKLEKKRRKKRAALRERTNIQDVTCSSLANAYGLAS